MKYTLQENQSWSSPDLQSSLNEAGIDASIDGHGPRSFTVSGDDPRIDTVVQEHLQTDWVLENLRKDKLKEINDAMENEMSIITSKYPEAEMRSWTKQEQEAREFLVHEDETKVPMIASIAQQRDMWLPELAQRIIAKADAYSEAVAFAVGKRQFLEDEIMNPEITKEELEITKW